MVAEADLRDTIRSAATRLSGESGDLEALLRLTKKRRFILLGEASHGTAEFYSARAEICKRLIQEQGLSAIAIEGDWPSVYRVNRYVRGMAADESADQALEGFQRFPLWMWRNTVFRDFVQWLREYNLHQLENERIGVYGLDMYSLYESIAEVLRYLDEVDPAAAEQARARYDCLDDVANEQQYGYGVHLGRAPSCEDQVVAQLEVLLEKRADYLQRGGMARGDEQFQAEQNARLVKNAEHYYRNMFSSRVSTWNMRDRHMSETLEALSRHLSRGRDTPARIAVWAHNSHLGDARATGMGDRGDFNLGQLTRQSHGDQALLVGMTTYTGTVTAASSWDGPAELKQVRPGRPDSFEGLLHNALPDDYFLDLTGPAGAALAAEDRLERAIGVLYLPATERASHYFRANLSQQFDALFHFDQTRALQPLDTVAQWQRREPDTYPFGV